MSPNRTAIRRPKGLRWSARAALTFTLVLVVWAAGFTVGEAQMRGDILGLQGFSPVRIQIDRGEKQTLLVKEADRWRVMEPVRDQADQRAVENLLNRLTSLTIADVLEGDRGSYGFNPPQASVRLWNAAGDVRELLIGNLRSPVSLFVKAAGSDTVYAISNVSMARIGEYPMGFVDRVLMRLEPDQLASIDVSFATEGGTEEFSIARRDGAWVFEDDEAVAFDVDSFVQNVRLIQVASQAEDTEELAADFYPAPGTARFVLTDLQGNETAVEVGTLTPSGKYRYLQVSGREELYRTSRFYGDQLIRQARGINDQLLGLDFEKITEFKLDFGAYALRNTELQNPAFISSTAQLEEEGITFVRNDDGAWERKRSIAFNMDPLMDAIKSVNAIGVAPPDADSESLGFGTDEDAMSLDITFTDGSTLQMEIGSAAQGGRYIRTTARQGVYVTTAESVRQIEEALATVRTSLLPFEPERAVRIEVVQVDDEGSESRKTVEKQDAGWVRNGQPVEEKRVNDLLNALVELAADSLPPPPETAEELGFYPAPGSMRIEVGLDDGSEYALNVGATVEVGAGWFATKNFYVSVSDLEDLMFIREQAMNRVLRPLEAL